MSAGTLHRCRAALVLAVTTAVLLGCGGGGGEAPQGAAPAPAPPAAPVPQAALPAMVDSFGRTIAEADFGRNEATAVGIEGTVARGVPVADTTVRIVDSRGQAVLATTDGNGYFRVRADGLAPPLLATVTLPDGGEWRAFSTRPLQARAFVTLNVTPLSEKIVGDAAALAGLQTVTPAALAAQPGALRDAIEALRTLLAPLLAETGLDLEAFDPVNRPFLADGTGLDAVLDRIRVERAPSGRLAIRPTFAVSGRVEGLLQQGELQVADGAGSAADVAGDRFWLPDRVPTGAGYDVRVVRQPPGLACTVERGAGTMSAAPVDDVLVRCSPPPPATLVDIAGTVSGVDAGGLSLGANGETIEIPANASTFRFPTAVPLGTAYDIGFNAPPGLVCTVDNGRGRAGIDSPPAVGCARRGGTTTQARFWGPVIGLGHAAGLRLSVAPVSGWTTSWSHVVDVPAGATSWESQLFPYEALTTVLYGASAWVRVAQHPPGLDCVKRPVPAGHPAQGQPGGVAIECGPTATIRGTVQGLTAGPLDIAIVVPQCLFLSHCWLVYHRATVPAQATSYVMASATGALRADDWFPGIVVETQPPGLHCQAATRHAGTLLPIGGVDVPITCRPN